MPSEAHQQQHHRRNCNLFNAKQADNLWCEHERSTFSSNSDATDGLRFKIAQKMPEINVEQVAVVRDHDIAGMPISYSQNKRGNAVCRTGPHEIRSRPRIRFFAYNTVKPTRKYASATFTTETFNTKPDLSCARQGIRQWVASPKHPLTHQLYSECWR